MRREAGEAVNPFKVKNFGRIFYYKIMKTDTRDYEKQWPGLPIKYLILACNDFIIFIDHEYDIDWKTNDIFDKRTMSKEELIEFNNIRNEIAYIESIPCDDLSEKIILNFKRQIGEALVRNFDNDFTNAKKMLLYAKEYIINRNTDKSRFLFLKSSGVVCAVTFSLIVISWIFRDILLTVIGKPAFYLWLSLLFGAIGAFFSIILRIGKTTLDYNASKKLHYMEGASKVVAGMISGFLIALCIKVGILLPILNKIDYTNIAMILGAIIGGASERLAPSIIKKIE